MSTILEALRKLEKEQPERTPADAAELDRKVLAREASERPRPLRLFARVVTAVVLSGVAGVSVTLAALSFWQSRNFETHGRGATPAVAAAEAERVEEPSVVIVADILKQNAAESAAALGSAEPVPARALPRSSAVTVTSAEPTAESFPIARVVRERDLVSELAATREARVSRAPPEVVPVAPVEPAALEVGHLQAELGSVGPVEIALVEVAAAPLPVIVRDPVPSVVVRRTIWHPKRERRRAELSLLEGGETRIVELREGQSIGPLELAEIGPTGVIFLHEGVEIRRRVGAPRQ
jgi:hypothetical protein